jgi:hypothetical protein
MAMSHGSHNGGCKPCHSNHHCDGETSNDNVFDTDAENITAGGRNSVIVARTPGATVTLPESDDFKDGESITILAPFGSVNLVVDDAEEQTLPPAHASVLGGEGVRLYLVKSDDCDTPDLWVPVCC